MIFGKKLKQQGDIAGKMQIVSRKSSIIKTSMVIVANPINLPCYVNNGKYIDNQETIAVYRVTFVCMQAGLST